MCLEEEWFQEADARKARRDAEGVSLEEATECLAAYASTATPIAIEMADWIFTNWSLEQVYGLPDETRASLFDIIERELRPLDDELHPNRTPIG